MVKRMKMTKKTSAAEQDVPMPTRGRTPQKASAESFTGLPDEFLELPQSYQDDPQAIWEIPKLKWDIPKVFWDIPESFWDDNDE